MSGKEAVLLARKHDQDDESLIQEMIASGMAKEEDTELLKEFLAAKEYEIWSPECSQGGQEILLAVLAEEKDNG